MALSNKVIYPPNFAMEGMVFGYFGYRNLGEAAALTLPIGYLIWRYVDIAIKYKIYVTIIVLLPIALLAIIGIQGLPLSQYVFYLMRYTQNKRVLTSPDERARIQREKNLIKKRKEYMDNLAKEQKKKQRLQKNRKKIRCSEKN